MGRKNTTRHRPQVVKASRAALAHRVEDRIARRHVRRAVEQSYRDEARHETIMPGGGRVLTFTDPSFAA